MKRERVFLMKVEVKEERSVFVSFREVREGFV